MSDAFMVRQHNSGRPLQQHHHQQQYCHPSFTLFLAKKTKKQQSRADMDDVNRWYESVRSDATPDAVFWEEMDRQRLWNQIGSENKMDFVTDTGSSPYRGGGGAATAAAASAVASTATSLSGFQNNMLMLKPKATQLQQQELLKVERSTESTLLEYVRFAVPDNWISEPLVAMFGNMEDLEAETMELEEQNRRIEEELMTLDENDDNRMEPLSIASELQANIKNFNDAWMTDAEPWDLYGQPRNRRDRALRVKPDKTNEFFFAPDSIHDAEDIQYGRGIHGSDERLYH
jgi:hypothetical protein